MGEAWIATCDARDWFPPEIVSSVGHLHAYAMLVDLAGALHLLRDRPGLGQVRKALRTNPSPEQLASSRCALRLAAAATSVGISAGVEVGNPPVDLHLQDRDVVFDVEIKSLFRLNKLMDVDRWLTELYDLTRSVVRDADVRLDGEALEVLGPEETRRIAQRIEDACRIVRAGLHAPVVRAGANWFEVLRSSAAQPAGPHIALPTVDLSTKLDNRLHKALSQAGRSGVTWVLLDSQDDLWHLSPWSHQPFEHQVEQLSSHVRNAVAGQHGLDGVVVTDGGFVLDLQTTDATVLSPNGAAGLRRRLDRGRVRKAIIISLSDRGKHETPMWRRVFDAEPSWVAETLGAVGLTFPSLLSR